jgi:3-methyladenine DNA glycosylase AlkD
MKNLFLNLRKELKSNSDPKVAKINQRFFKHKVKCYGIKAKDLEIISRKYYQQIKELGKGSIFSLCEELFKSGFGEDAAIAAKWSYKQNKLFEKKDIKIFEKWIENYIDDWAKCDAFCNHTIGEYILKYPDQIGVLKKWAKSKNMWLRRASVVSLIVPARKGLFLEESFELSNILMKDEEDLVQKGYGWLLKVLSQTHTKEVFTFVLTNKNQMTRTALRYAIEKMPQDLRQKAMS